MSNDNADIPALKPRVNARGHDVFCHVCWEPVYLLWVAPEPPDYTRCPVGDYTAQNCPNSVGRARLAAMKQRLIEAGCWDGNLATSITAYRAREIVLVCGGRNYGNLATAYKVLDGLNIERIIQGGASGADAIGRFYALDRGLPVDTYAANWAEHGKAAGPLRNARMLSEGKPSLVVAFPGGRGTADMVRKAKAASIAVLEVAP